MAADPILRVTDGTIIIDLLGGDSGFELANPYWNPQIAQLKGGGDYANSAIAEGRRLTSGEYDNVIETIPLSVRGRDQDKAIKTVRKLMQLGRQAQDYWTEPYEYNDVWIEVKPGCNDCLTGYSRIVKMSVPELTNPFGQPFFSAYGESIMEDITLIIEREPFWMSVKPGTMIGPLYNLIDNPDFEIWNFGVIDSQPDGWTDLQTLWITGTNNRETTAPRWGNNSLKIRVSGSTLAGAAKGVTQNLNDVRDNTQYTIIAWVRSKGVSNGVGRILVNYSDQLELYRSSDSHGWILYTNVITTGASDTVSINCEILTTAANTDGTIYIDGLMFIEGDYRTEAQNGVLPYISGGHIVDHWDNEAGDINYIDVWNVPGDIDGLVRIEAINNTSSVTYKTFRIGQKRSNNIFQFENYLDPPGIADASSSNNDYVQNSIAGTSVQMGTFLVNGNNAVSNSRGRFKLFARIYDDKASSTNLKANVEYWIGTNQVNLKSLDSYDAKIAQNWHILDLTQDQAIIYQAGKEIIPSSLGYNIKLNRSVSTANNARLDFAMLMPTDGGYVEATMDPTVKTGDLFFVDNTKMGFSAGGSFQSYKSDWESVASIGSSGSAWLRILRDQLYITQRSPSFWREEIQSTVTTYQIHTIFVANLICATVEYNGRLYMGVQVPASNTLLYVSNDGIGWSQASAVGMGVNAAIEDMFAFRGILYIASNGAVYTWDGTNLVLLRDFGASFQNYFIEYNNKLFFTTDTGLYSYNPDTGWDPIILSANCGPMVVLNDTLYLGTANNGRIYSYDGNIATLLKDFTDAELTNIRTMEVYNDEIYASGSNSTATPSVWKSSDGITWAVEFDPGRELVVEMISFNGQLYILASDEIGGTGDLYVKSSFSGSIEYKTSSYKGNPFFAQPRTFSNEKRHRYFFLYDRAGDIHNIDDAALVGIGFVPRYLSLRGND